jgi:serine/threonine-protein phosphatase 2A regulatory subunit B'
LIFGLLELFNTPDPRERDYLKTIVHCIYMKVPATRRFIRVNIGNIFSTFLEASAQKSLLQKQHRGIPELLEILTSVIDGFQVPVKDDHWQYFEMQILPLHRDTNLSVYQQQLQQCVATFLLKVRQRARCTIV